ncbi:MAG: response regulator [Alphaproteobacteria bacterium]|nr:response regulator [Alphaproteobacteria bacterium]
MKPDQIAVVVTARNNGVARTIRMALRGVGVRNIHLASSSAEGLQLLQSVGPDVLIVVVDGPDNDEGVAFIRSVRDAASGPYAATPIVAASSRRDLQTVQAVIGAGGNEYVVLPASGDALFKKIANAIRVRAADAGEPGRV